MTDLTDADLDLAVARVMLRDDIHIEADAWMQDGTCYLCRSLEGGDAEEFRPSQGGAAAWEVLEWVLGQRLHVEMWRDRLDGCTVCWILDRTGNGRLVADVIGPADGPTDAIALCRAVVALGEAG